MAQYLKEEIAAEGLVQKLPAFSEFLNAASFSDCEDVNFMNIARATGVSGQTIRGYVDILTDTLLGRFLPSYRHRPKRRTGRIITGSELFGKAFENWVFHERCAYKS